MTLRYLMTAAAVLLGACATPTAPEAEPNMHLRLGKGPQHHRRRRKVVPRVLQASRGQAEGLDAAPASQRANNSWYHNKSAMVTSAVKLNVSSVNEFSR